MAPKRKADPEEDVLEEEALSSDEEQDIGDEDEDMEGSDEDGEEEEESEEEILEPKILPNRVTRGGRMSQLMEEQESGDEEFWGQDFFAEEEADGEQEFEASESEQEDVPDSDFSEAEEEDDEDDDAVEARVRREERGKKKTLKPPGAAGSARRPPPLEPAGPTGGGTTTKPPLSPAAKAAIKAARLAEAAELQAQAPSLRRSTLQKTEQAEQERQFADEVRPKKKRRAGQQQRLLSQDELLAEAAQTEIENLRSLEILQAAEEEVRQRAAVKRGGYTGPCIRYKTKQINGEGVLTCEVANMLLPTNMRRKTAPAPKPIPICVVTGRPAKYRHPATKQPYFDVAAYHVLQQQLQQQRLQQQQQMQGSMYSHHTLHAGAVGIQQLGFEAGYYAPY